jgi:hypothetical protein
MNNNVGLEETEPTRPEKLNRKFAPSKEIEASS